MTARPIRRNAQTPDRNGKIFYTSTTSLSHISKAEGNEIICNIKIKDKNIDKYFLDFFILTPFIITKSKDYN